jgi:hypothetical protein
MSDKPSQLLRELGPIESGQMKVLATCCGEKCYNEVEVVLTPVQLVHLKEGRAAFECPLHRLKKQ